MKKLWLFLIVFLFPLGVFASTNTYTRTPEKLLVPNDVIVDSNNIQAILQTPAVASSEKIYDFADLYSDKEEKALFSKITDYIDETGIDLVIVTTKDLKGFGIRDYAYHFYDYNDFKRDGVIFVIHMGGEEPEIFMGNSGDKAGKVFSVYTDVRIGQTLKYVYQDIKNNNYYDATADYIKILQGFFNLDQNGDYHLDENGSIIRSIPWTEMVILSFAVTFIFVVLLIYRIRGNNRLDFKDDLDNKIDETTLVVKIEMDDYIGTSVKKK